MTFNATEDGTLRALSPENLQCFKTFTVPLGENKSVLASRSEVRISSSTRNVQNPDVCCRRCLGISWAQTAISTQIAKKALAGSQVKWLDAPLRLRRLSDSRQTSFAYHHFDCGFRLLVNRCSQQTGECTLGSFIVRGSAPEDFSITSKDHQRALPQYRTSVSKRRFPDVQLLQLARN